MLTVAGPRWQTGPRGGLEAARETVELAAVAGLRLDPWQVSVLEAGLAERPDGKWAALEVALVVPRQNGKGAILEALELAGLFLFDEKLILHSAHEFKTASEAFRRVWGLIEQTPDLDRQVFRKLQNNNDMSIELKSGQRLRFVARSTGSGRGFSGDRVILDEAYKLPDRVVAALAPTLSARPNPQLWYTSSAPLPNEDSDVLRRICRRGREGSDRLAFIEYAASSDADLDDRDAWLEANPSLGVVRTDGGGISEDFIAGVERGLYTAEDFARERLGIWPERGENRFAEISEPDWFSCLDEKSGPLDPVSFAVDVAEDRSWSAIGIAAQSGRGGTHIELSSDHEQYDYRPGTDWVVSRCKALHVKWKRPFGLVKGSPAWSLEADLRAAGVEIREVSGQEFAQACGQAFDAAAQHTLRHLGQPALTSAVANLTKRKSGDAFVWDRRNSSVDISPLVAVTVAKFVSDQHQELIESGIVDPNDDDWE